jgi:4-amino-4-deoxy-L-arabinose transferase-like glycosyltransferase
LRAKSGSRLEAFLENLERFLPWTLFLPAALWWWWRDRDPRRRPLVVWTVVIAVAVSLSSEQRARYFLPVVPSLALLVAELLARAPLEPSRRGRRVLLASLAGAALMAVGAAVVLLQMPPRGRLPRGRGRRAAASPPRWGCWPSGTRRRHRGLALAVGGILRRGTDHPAPPE